MAVDHEDGHSFFDCKLRRMFIVAPVQQPKIVEMEPEDDADVEEEKAAEPVVGGESESKDKETNKTVEQT